VKRKLAAFIEQTGADELIFNTSLYRHEDRLRSYEIAASLKV